MFVFETDSLINVEYFLNQRLRLSYETYHGQNSEMTGIRNLELC